MNFKWVQASLELFQNFVDQNGQGFVGTGTCAEYDWNYGFCSEFNTRINPHTLYGTCKSSLQKMIEHFAKQTGVSQSWERIFFLYGPHEALKRLASVVTSSLQNKPAKCSHSNQIRDFLHVQDVANAFVKLLENDIQGSVNIGPGKPVVLKTVIYQIAKELGKPESVNLDALPTQESDPPLLVANIRRPTREVGWNPTISLEKGLSETIKWWKQEITGKIK